MAKARVVFTDLNRSLIIAATKFKGVFGWDFTIFSATLHIVIVLLESIDLSF